MIQATRTLRLLHVGKYYPPATGGMEQVLADLCAQSASSDSALAGSDEIAAEPIEQHVLVHQHPGSDPADDPHWLTRAPVWRTLLFTPISVSFPRHLRRLLRSLQPDLLLLHLPNPAAFWGLLLARRTPVVVMWHSDVEITRQGWPMRCAHALIKPLEQALLQQAQQIWVTSPRYAAASTALAPWQDKMLVTPLQADRRRLPTPSATALEQAEARWRRVGSNGLRLLCVGRLTYYKGFDRLITRLAHAPNVQLIIVGDGEERAKLAEIISTLGLANRVQLAGALPDEARNALLATCDVFCLPSIERTEAFGVVLLEAMRFGRPLLVSDIPGSGVAWVAGDAGLAVPPDDDAAWLMALHQLHDAALRSRLSVIASARFNQHFDGQGGGATLAQRCAAVLPHVGLARRPLVVIPARDEADTIAAIVQALVKAGLPDVLVVNDGSRDATAAEARRAGARVLNPLLPLGAWGASQAGLRWALRHGFDAVVTMDGDGQHEAADVPRLLAALANAHAVVGAYPERGSPARKLAWALFRKLTGFGLNDLTSGFRAYNRFAMDLLASEEATLLDYQDVGVLLMLRHAGLHIAEVPVTMRARLVGESRIFYSWAAIAFYMAETLLLIFARWQTRPTPPVHRS